MIKFIAGVAVGYTCRDLIYELLYKAEQALKTEPPSTS